MITIVYASTAVRDMPVADLVELLEAARSRNDAERVTGMLLYADGSFMQQLEGDLGAVERIFDSIKADPRHTDLRLLSHRSISYRRYPDWAMGFAHPDADTLGERLWGYRAPLRAPLASSELVTNTHVAERLLFRYALSNVPVRDDAGQRPA